MQEKAIYEKQKKKHQKTNDVTIRYFSFLTLNKIQKNNIKAEKLYIYFIIKEIAILQILLVQNCFSLYKNKEYHF